MVPAEPLSLPGQKPAKEQAVLLAQYAEDVGKYNNLAERHNDLISLMAHYCLAEK